MANPRLKANLQHHLKTLNYFIIHINQDKYIFVGICN